MNLIEQFPDVSMVIREKRNKDAKHNASSLFKDINYIPIKVDQSHYDSEFKKRHYRVLFIITALVAGISVLIFNSHVLLRWLMS